MAGHGNPDFEITGPKPPKIEKQQSIEEQKQFGNEPQVINLFKMDSDTFFPQQDSYDTQNQE